MTGYCRYTGIACELATEYGYCKLTGCVKRSGDRVVNDLCKLPTVDAVEAVRCKDCKYWKTADGVNQSKKVKFCTYQIGHHYARRDGDFCSRGERKDGDHYG